MKKRVGILISGRGSNMEALIAAARATEYPAEIVVVISDQPAAAGLEKARQSGVPIVVVEPELHAPRANFDETLDRALVEAQVEIVCLAGFMRILTAAFVAKWDGRLLNVHPSLLPAFRGLQPQAQALAAGVRISGCTVHYVVSAVDSGPIIAQAAVPVLGADTLETLTLRILDAEHKAYPQALALVATGSVQVSNGRVVGHDSVNRLTTLFSPSI